MKKILIVEDNDMNRKLFRDILTVHGYEVYEAASGSQALCIASQIIPDLMILDMQLPEICGQEVVRWMKNEPQMSHIPIIAVTAYAMKSDEIRFLESGVDAYLPKPISIETFMKTIEKTFILSTSTTKVAC